MLVGTIVVKVRVLHLAMLFLAGCAVFFVGGALAGFVSLVILSLR
jgi:hypothetical protein